VNGNDLRKLVYAEGNFEYFSHLVFVRSNAYVEMEQAHSKRYVCGSGQRHITQLSTTFAIVGG